ncbi:hypothetical protein CBS470a_006656 [Colletotrichum nupharicola]|nr:hypothetical protein CBS470a_006656 [Colletotrichum nupharicola]
MSATLSASTLVATPSPTETTAAACISISPDSNGHVPYGACHGFWLYVPSFGGNLALAILFGLSALVHLVQAVMCKQRYCWVIIMAGVWETSAFVLRTLGAKNGRVLPFYIISSLTFMLAPLFQLIFIAVFTAVVVQLHFKVRKNPPSAWNANSLQLIWVIFIVLVLTFVSTSGGVLKGHVPIDV